jgi:uncharacterized protein
MERPMTSLRHQRGLVPTPSPNPCPQGGGKFASPVKAVTSFEIANGGGPIVPSRLVGEGQGRGYRARINNIRGGLRAGAVLLLASLISFGIAPSHAADAPLALTWAALIPADKPQTRPPKPFFAGATPTVPGPSDPGAAGHTQQAPSGDAKWMSGVSKTPATNSPAPVVADLNGKRVRLGGYVVPLDFDATKVTEFLLVPFVGACIHVPPPPANQIVYVKATQGITLKGQFDPVYVTGVLSTDGQFTGLADTGYSLAAEAVDAKAD